MLTTATGQSVRAKQAARLPASWLLVGFALMAVGGAGSVSFAQSTEPHVAEQPEHSTPPVDPARASLRLEDIEPRPEAPAATPAIPPLSKRAATQLDDARRLLHESRFAEASQEIEKALRYDPNHPLVHRAMALVSWESGSTELARTHARRAVELDPNDRVAHYLMGRLAVASAEPDEALRSYRLALLSQPVDPAPDYVALTHYHLASLLAASGYLSAALAEYEAYEHAVAALPADAPRCQDLVTLVATNNGRAGEQMAAIYERLGKFAEAADKLRPIATHAGASPAVRARFARLLSHAGLHDEALAEARKLLDSDEKAVDLLLELHERAGDRDGAIADLRAVLAEQPHRVNVATALVGALLKAGDQHKADELLTEILTRNPKQSELWWEKHRLAVEREDWRAAFAAAVSALAAAPDRFSDAASHVRALAKQAGAVDAIKSAEGPPADAERGSAAHYLYGVLFEAVGDAAAAERSWRAALSGQPEWLAPRLALGELCLAQFRWEDAIQLAAPADVNVPPHNRLEWMLGRAYAGLDRHEEAAAHFNQAISLNRADTDSMYRLAIVYQDTGKVLRAQRQLESILESQPLHEASREELVRIYLSAGRFTDAADQVERLRAQGASPTRIARCAAAVEQNPRSPDFARFREKLEAGIKLGGPDARTLTLVAETYRREQDYEAARTALEQARQLDDSYEPAVQLLAETCGLLLDYERAESLCRELVRRYPNRMAYYADLSELLLNKQDFEDCLAVADQVLAREDLSPELRRVFDANALESLRLLGRDDELIERLRARADDPADGGPFRPVLLATLVRVKRTQAALELVRTWYEADPANPGTRTALVGVLLSADQPVRAQQRVLDWLAEDPQNQDLQRELIAALAGAKQFDAALELIRSLQARELPPSGERLANTALVPLYDLEYRVLATAERHDAAVELLTDMLRTVESRGPGLEHEFNRHDLQRRLALELIRAEKLEQASVRLTRWMSEAENDRYRYVYLNLLRLVNDRRGQLAQATELLEMAYKLQPNDESVNNDLGYTWADAGIRLDEAEKMIRYAVSRRPREAAYLDSLGWVLYKRGDFAAAVTWIERAVRMDENGDPVLFDHLGDARWRAGQREQATAAWRQSMESLEKHPDDEGDRTRIALRESLPRKLAAVEAGDEPELAPLAP